SIAPQVRPSAGHYERFEIHVPYHVVVRSVRPQPDSSDVRSVRPQPDSSDVRSVRPQPDSSDVRSVRLQPDLSSDVRSVRLQPDPKGSQSDGTRSPSPQKWWTLTPSSRMGRRPACVLSSRCTARSTIAATSRVAGA